ncbi:MAG: extracellular solute-binding protein [Lachnospiraceae bacterium]|nr:extracellular solute-binding protein [Lachnospiraceae bacterium]
MKKKLLSVLLCMAMTSTMLAGCGSKSDDTTADTAAGTTESAGGDEEAEVYMFIASPEYADAIGELINAYKEVKPNVTINYETTQNDYPTLLKAKLNSGECPDIFSSTSGKEIGTYLDYSYNLADQPLAGAMTDAVKSVMLSGEEVHGLSIKGNYFGVLYNKALFEEAGITEFPQTFAELETACEKLSTAGYTPFTTGFAEWWVFKHCFQTYLDAAGGDDVEGLVNKFASGEAKIADYPEIYDNFFDFIDLALKYGDAKPLETDLSGEDAAFASGTVGMMLGQGAWVEADILKINPDIQIGFDGYPVNDSADNCKIIAGSDQALRVNKDSKALQPTLDFLNWWYTSDYGKSWFKDVAQVIPPITDAEAPDMEVVKQGSALESSEGTATLSITYSTDSFYQAFGEIMQSYVAGTMDKDAACEQIEAKWVELDGSDN